MPLQKPTIKNRIIDTVQRISEPNDPLSSIGTSRVNPNEQKFYMTRSPNSKKGSAKISPKGSKNKAGFAKKNSCKKIHQNSRDRVLNLITGGGPTTDLSAENTEVICPNSEAPEVIKQYAIQLLANTDPSLGCDSKDDDHS